MNLEMPLALIQALSDRGHWAGLKLRHRFAGPTAPGELSWDNHRWVRYRAALAAIEDLLVDFAHAYDRPAAGDLPWEELLREPPGSYPVANRKQQERLAELTRRLAELGRELAQVVGTREDLHQGAPHPQGELRVRPRI